VNDVLRVGNCSGFYGDRLSAMRDMLEGGRVDVLTGDYLAELTMLILGRDQTRDPSLGYARTFLRQAEECLALALDRGVRLVANAGGLNAAALAGKLRELADRLGVTANIAHVEGDDLLPRADALGLVDPGLGKPLTANAYLGGFGIAAALTAGADVVVTGRVTDASLVVGAALAHFGWPSNAYDAMAGATVAGHVLECGTQATGGNFSGFLSLPRDRRPHGFPLAEIAADGSSVVTKHDGTGGAVTVDTVTAQLMYEIQSQTYLGPDVTTRLDTVQLTQAGPDRVRVSGVRGSAPPETLKVCLNFLGGYRNSAELLMVGLDIDAKAAWVRSQLESAISNRRPRSVEWSLARTDRPDAGSEEEAAARLRVTVRDPNPDVAGKAFTAPLVELALASYPGFTLTAPPAPATPYGVFRAAYVDRSAVDEVVVHHDGRREAIAPSREADGHGPEGRSREVPPTVVGPGERATEERAGLGGGTFRRSPAGGVSVPLGTFVHARSGDKGGDANVGLWVTHDDRDRYGARVGWLLGTVTVDFVRQLVPEAAELDVGVFRLPNLGGVNIVLHGLLGDGVAASSRFDPQAKGLGEWVRSRHVEIPEELL
jgi:hypothetical protein